MFYRCTCTCKSESASPTITVHALVCATYSVYTCTLFHLFLVLPPFPFPLLFHALSPPHSCSVLEVIGEVQRPMLILSESFLHIETCYKNIPVTHTLTLLNTTLLHTQFQWINEEVRKGKGERLGEGEKGGGGKTIVGDLH